MSIYRQAAKVDASQAILVKSLRLAGIQVYIIRKPCDLLLRFYCSRHSDFCWQTLEAKTPATKSGHYRKRYDQHEQDKFLSESDTPIATDFQSAWEVLNKRHQIGLTCST